MPYATNVIATTGRLIQAGLIKPPPWWSTVMAHPPMPCNTRYVRAPGEPAPKLIKYLPKDMNRKRLRAPKPKIKEIRFQDDVFRDRFFRDHPWELARPRTVVESDIIGKSTRDGPEGLEWVRLDQRTKNPVPDESVLTSLAETCLIRCI